MLCSVVEWFRHFPQWISGVFLRGEKLQMEVIWGAFDWFVALNFGGLGICQGLQ